MQHSTLQQLKKCEIKAEIPFFSCFQIKNNVVICTKELLVCVHIHTQTYNAPIIYMNFICSIVSNKNKVEAT